MKLRVSEIGELVLVALASVAGAVLAPDLPFMGIPIAAVALGWLAYRRGFAASVFTALAATAFAALLAGSWDVAAFTGPALLAAGPGAAWVLTRWPTIRTVALLTVALLAAGILFQTVVGAEAGRSFLGQLRFGSEQVGHLLVAAFKAQGVADEETLKEITSMARMSYLLWPMSFTYLYGLAAALAVPLVSRVGRVLGRTVSSMPALADVDLSIHIVWAAIAGLGVLAAGTYFERPQGILWAIGMNLLQIVRLPLFVQGLGDFAALYRKAKVGPTGRAIGFTFLTLSEVFIPSVSVVGLLDLFANFRKLPRGGSAGPGGLESRPGSV